eukprot:TRINITY_DN561_c0_g1_i2.p1 TRINITY_DN561_c0_g1~~TRINITY_DN561_c0_g1_i2.p1  ORF type:complete len:255 (+),score=65.37 TRINITY_DN561_c0_g1_i2:2-766(+)
MIRRPPRSTPIKSSAASDVYKRQVSTQSTGYFKTLLLTMQLNLGFKGAMPLDFSFQKSNDNQLEKQRLFDGMCNDNLKALQVPGMGDQEVQALANQKEQFNVFHTNMMALANNASIQAKMSALQFGHKADDCKAGSHWIISVPHGTMSEEMKIEITRKASASSHFSESSGGFSVGFGPVSLGHNRSKTEASSDAQACCLINYSDKAVYQMKQMCACCGKDFGVASVEPSNFVEVKGEDLASFLAKHSATTTTSQ